MITNAITAISTLAAAAIAGSWQSRNQTKELSLRERLARDEYELKFTSQFFQEGAAAVHSLQLALGQLVRYDSKLDEVTKQISEANSRLIGLRLVAQVPFLAALDTFQLKYAEVAAEFSLWKTSRDLDLKAINAYELKRAELIEKLAPLVQQSDSQMRPVGAIAAVEVSLRDVSNRIEKLKDKCDKELLVVLGSYEDHLPKLNGLLVPVLSAAREELRMPFDKPSYVALQATMGQHSMKVLREAMAAAKRIYDQPR